MNGVISIMDMINKKTRALIGADKMSDYAVAMTVGGMPAVFWVWGTSVFGKLAKQYVKEGK